MRRPSIFYMPKKKIKNRKPQKENKKQKNLQKENKKTIKPPKNGKKNKKKQFFHLPLNTCRYNKRIRA
jgi:hypothetical protein